MRKRTYLIAHEGQIDLAAIVIAVDENAAAVKYYEAARHLLLDHGRRGTKKFKIGDITCSDGIPIMKERTLVHHADIDGAHWLQDVIPINQWAKFGHHDITQQSR